MSLSPYIFDCKATKGHYLDGSEGELEQEHEIAFDTYIFQVFNRFVNIYKSQSISSSMITLQSVKYMSRYSSSSWMVYDCDLKLTA